MAACTPVPTNSNDVITCSPPTNANVSALNGNDTIKYLGGTGGILRGNAGNDTVDIESGSIALAEGNDGDDTITLQGGIVRGPLSRETTSVPNIAINGGAGTDIINLEGGSVGTATLAASVTGGGGTDYVYVKGATVTGSIRGDSGSLILEITSGAVRNVFGGTAGNTITVNQEEGKSTSVGRIAGQNKVDIIQLLGGQINQVSALWENDTITLDGAVVSEFIVGDEGNDIINLLSGSLGQQSNDNKNVRGDAGRDIITLNRASIGGSIFGGTDVDELILLSGFVYGSAQSGAGNDRIIVGDARNLSAPGPTIFEGVDGWDDDDEIFIINGTVGYVTDNNGNDTIWLDGGTVIAGVAGGNGNDEINLGTKDAGKALGGTTIGGDVLGGTGNDTIDWQLGAVAGAIVGGDGSDTLSVAVTSGYDGSQILDGGDDTGTGDGFIDDLTISGKTVAVPGSKLLNWEKLTLAGGGLTLSDGLLAVGGSPDGTDGLFLTDGAFLRAGAPLGLTGNLSIGAGSVYQQLVSGTHAVTGQLVNAGAINLRNGAGGDVLSVGGNYTGGGQLLIDIDNDIADRMAIAGDVLGRPTQIATRLMGQYTSGIPIKVVDVGGTTREGNFTAANFNLGSYSYALQLDGSTWQFVPTEMLDEGTLYPTVGKLLQQFGKQTIATHFERTGSWARAAGEDVAVADGVVTLAGGDRNANGNVWIRAIGQWAEGEGELEGGPARLGAQTLSYDTDTVGVQGGVDAIIADTPSHSITAGLFGQTGRLSGTARNETDRRAAGSSEAEAWGIGGSVALDTESFYVEAVGAWNSYDISIESRSGSSDTDGYGYYLSLEAGHEFPVSTSITLVPQAQFAWMNTDIDTFTDGGGTTVSFDDHTMPIGRLGLAADVAAGTYHAIPLRLTGILNYWQEFGDAAQTSVGGSPLSIDQASGTIEAGAGFHWGTSQTPLHLHGELTYSEAVGGDGEQSWDGTMGMRIAF